MGKYIMSVVLDDIEAISSKPQFLRLAIMLAVTMGVFTVFGLNIILVDIRQISERSILCVTFFVVLVMIVIATYVGQYAARTSCINNHVEKVIDRVKSQEEFVELKERIMLGKDSLSVSTALNAMALMLFRGIGGLLVDIAENNCVINRVRVGLLTDSFDIMLIATFFAFIVGIIYPNCIMYSLYNSKMARGYDSCVGSFNTRQINELEVKDYGFCCGIKNYTIRQRISVFSMIGIAITIILTGFSISIVEVILCLINYFGTELGYIYRKFIDTKNFYVLIILVILYAITNENVSAKIKACISYLWNKLDVKS